MTAGIFFRRFLTAFLALSLILALVPGARAGEAPEATLCPEETAAPTLPETVPTTSAEETLPDPTEETQPQFRFDCPYHLYFGLLHAHTDFSSGVESAADAFTRAAELEGLDFYAVTDHSNSFDNAASGSLTADGSGISREWAEGKAAAQAVTGEDFLGLFGFEMTWPEIRQLGHITTFGTPGWVSRDQEGFREDPDALAHYFEALAEVPGSVSQFCHPGDQYGDFEGFRGFTPGADASVQLLETLGEGSLDAYIRALDQYWHLAPTASRNDHNGTLDRENDLRTVILAEELTQECLFAAIRAHRVYATQDKDLHLYYQLDGQDMGSILYRAPAPEITLSLHDPTDCGSCTVEVLTEGGTLLAREETAPSSQVTLSVPGGFRWYLLKISQADGDVAVTAPVWVEGFENMGISRFSSGEEIPLSGRELTLSLELFNDERIPFCLTALEIYRQEDLVWSSPSPGTLEAGKTLSVCIPYTQPETGTVTLRALVRGTVLGEPRSCEAELTLRFRPAAAVTDLLIDTGHGNTGTHCLTRLGEILRDSGYQAAAFSGPIPVGGEALLIPPLGQLPDAAFIRDAAQLLSSGGSLILLADPDSAAAANGFLEALGSGLGFGETVLPEGSSQHFNGSCSWWDTLAEGACLRHGECCPVTGGQWLARDAAGEHCLLAREETAAGGFLLAAGCHLFCDSLLPRQESLWNAPEANETLLRGILGSAKAPVPLQSIDRVRWETPGSTFRIRGYVTAGTSNPHTTFPDTLYLQDDTGGIAVTGFSQPGIQTGAPLEILGTLRMQGAVPTLEYTAHRQLPGEYHHFCPRTMACKTALDYESYGGQLVQIQGTVTELSSTEDRKGICRLVLKDTAGDTAPVEIHEAIRSGSTGENRLAKQVKKGRAFRVLGILELNDRGKPVIRVRNCDEVVYIPPKADPTNPKTGDRRFPF